MIPLLWNFPLILAMYKVAYGLAAGNTVVLKPASETPVIGLKNGTKFGLSAGLVTNDISKALYLAEGLEAGMVHVNDSSIGADAVCPFGGCKSSGQGREGGRYSLEAMTQVKWITIQKSQKRYPF